MKKKILLVVRWPIGGIRTFLTYTFKQFDASKWNITILAPDLDETKILLTELAHINISYIPVHDMPNDGSSGFLKLFRSVAIELLKNRYDLLHSHGFISGMCAALPAFVLKIPHLMTLHETINDNQFSGPKGRFKKIAMYAFFHLITKVHFVSYDAQKNIFQYFKPLKQRKDKCIVITNGINIQQFIQAESRNFITELNLDHNVFLIGFMGRFMSPKGFRYLIEAIEILKRKNNLPKTPLVLTFGWGGFIREEIQLIRKKGVENNFRFMPFTPNVAGAIKGMDVVAMPSLREACGLLAMETLVCGTPLIGTDCIGLREVLKGTPAKVVPKADAKGLAFALKEEMMKSSKSFFIDYRETAAKRYDIRNTYQSIIGLYSDMIAPSKL